MTQFELQDDEEIIIRSAGAGSGAQSSQEERSPWWALRIFSLFMTLCFTILGVRKDILENHVGLATALVSCLTAAPIFWLAFGIFLISTRENTADQAPRISNKILATAWALAFVALWMGLEVLPVAHGNVTGAAGAWLASHVLLWIGLGVTAFVASLHPRLMGQTGAILTNKRLWLVKLLSGDNMSIPLSDIRSASVHTRFSTFSGDAATSAGAENIYTTTVGYVMAPRDLVPLAVYSLLILRMNGDVQEFTIEGADPALWASTINHLKGQPSGPIANPVDGTAM